jgi:hypothetical protein
MTRLFGITKAVATLLVAVFVVMFVWGIYTALDSAPVYTLSTSENPSMESTLSAIE